MRVLVVLLLLCAHAGAETVFEQDTPYGHLRVTEEDGHRDLWSGDVWQGTESIADPVVPQWRQVINARCVLRRAASVLEVGLGTGQIVKDWLTTAAPASHFELIEIDSAVEQVARRWFALPTDPRVHVTIAEGAAYLRTMTAQYDAVIVDAYLASGIPASTTTAQFYDDVRRAVKPHGVALVNSYDAPPTTAPLLRARFAHLCVVPEYWYIGSDDPVDGCLCH